MATKQLIVCGDCRELVAGLPAGSVHAIVSDPPYEIGFMGRSWDRAQIAHDVGLWRACLAAIKPGGHVAAFGATRTQHRLACAIEDAGFEIRDALAWLYGQGFPKSLNLSKQADRAAGAEVAHELGQEYEPQTALAAEMQGTGTALKPAYEPVVVGRAPLAGSVLATMAAHGTGALNIDECRLGLEAGVNLAGVHRQNTAGGVVNAFGAGGLIGTEIPTYNPAGRWPANVLCDEYAAAEVDAQSGRTVSRASPTDRMGRRPAGAYATPFGENGNPCRNGPAYSDEGGASRFFYCAKATTAEREAGLDGVPMLTSGQLTGRADGSAGLDSPRAGAGRTAVGRRNLHPTVKPIALMRWIVRLLSRPGDTILDPFAGSGTTGIACALEGRNFIGFELDPAHARIAELRIAFARGGGFGDGDAPNKTAIRQPAPATRQVSLLDL